MSVTLTAIAAILGIALLLYVLLGGADFGAGILELAVGKRDQERQRELIAHAMAPVWEANHLWLIVAVVILFVGFPTVYTMITTYLFLPVMAILVGIVARGCAFAFRYYDPYRDWYAAYSRIFALASAWTAFFLGVTAGAAMLGRINPEAADFHGLFVSPWFNPFCFVLGVVTILLFALLAAVYLSGETSDRDLRAVFLGRAKRISLLLAVAAAAVFAAAYAQSLPLTERFLKTPLSIVSLLAAAAAFAALVWMLRRGGNTLAIRGLAVLIVTFILLGWYGVEYPAMLRYIKNGEVNSLTFQSAASPPPTQRALLAALAAALLITTPALAYLFSIFKWETVRKERY